MNQKIAERKNIYEYILQCNMARIMPALLFGLGLYSPELKKYMDTKMAYNLDQNSYDCDKTRDLLINILQR